MSTWHHFSVSLQDQFCLLNICLFLSSFLSPAVGAELLSILDETENGFIWEQLQGFAEQAHGAWLGISVKGPAALLQIVPSFLSTTEHLLTFRFFISKSKFIKFRISNLLDYDLIYSIIIK